MALSYNNIGLVHANKGEHDKALEYWEKAHAILLNKLGPNHPNTKLVKGELDGLAKEPENKD